MATCYAVTFPELAHEGNLATIGRFARGTTALADGAHQYLTELLALQETYASQLSKLTERARKDLLDLGSAATDGDGSRRAAAQQGGGEGEGEGEEEDYPPAPVAPADDGVITLTACWNKTLTASEHECAVLGELHAALREDVLEPLAAATQHLKTTGSGLEDDRGQLTRRMDKLTASVDQARQQNNAALTAMSRPMKTEAQEEKALATKRRAHNQYIIALASANAERKKFYETDLPIILERTQDVQGKLLDSVATALLDTARLRQGSVSQLASRQSELWADVQPYRASRELTSWVRALKCEAFTPPAPLGFEAPPDAASDSAWVKREVCLEGSEVFLAAQMQSFNAQVMAVATKIGRAQHVVYGIEKLSDEYETNPQFGSSFGLMTQLYSAQNEVRELQSVVNRNHAVLHMLQNSSVEGSDADKKHAWKVHTYKRPTKCDYCHLYLIGLIRQGWHCAICDINVHKSCADCLPVCPGHADGGGGDADSRKGKRKGSSSASKYACLADFGSDDEFDSDWDDDGDDGTSQAIVMYAYESKGEEELSLRPGTVLSLLDSSKPEWWEGTDPAGAAGIFPASYVRAFKGDPRNQVRTLYDYTATADDQLSFPEDELITLVEPEADDGWCKGMYQGQVGLLPTNYIDAKFVVIRDELALGDGTSLSIPPSKAAEAKGEYIAVSDHARGPNGEAAEGTTQGQEVPAS